MKRGAGEHHAPADERDGGCATHPAPDAEGRPAGADGLPTFGGAAADPTPDPARPGADRRSFLRWPVFWRARLIEPGPDRSRDCLVLDFSPGGAKVRSSRPPAVGSEIGLALSPSVHFKGRVAWTQGGIMGIDFDPGTEGTAQLLERVTLDCAAESEPGAALEAAAPPRARPRRDRGP